MGSFSEREGGTGRDRDRDRDKDKDRETERLAFRVCDNRLACDQAKLENKVKREP